MSNAKQKATALLNTLPEQVSWDDILLVLNVKKQIDQGLHDSNDDYTLSIEETRMWIKKSFDYN